MPRGSRRRSGSKSPKRHRGSRTARKSPRRSRSPKRSPRRFRGVEDERKYQGYFTSGRRDKFIKRFKNLMSTESVKKALMNNESIITDLLVFHTCIPVDNFKEYSGLVEMQPINGNPPKSVEVSIATEFADRDTIIGKLSHPAKLLVEIVNSFTVIPKVSEPENTDAEQGLQLLQKFYALFVIAIGKENRLETSLKKIVCETLLNNVSPEKRGRLLPVLISRAIDALDTIYLMASDRKQSYNIANTSIRTDVKRLIDDIVTNTEKFLEMVKDDSEKALVGFVEYVQTKKSMHNALMYMSFKEREEVMKTLLSIPRFAPYPFDGNIVNVLPEEQKQKLLDRNELIASSMTPAVQTVSGDIAGPADPTPTPLPNTDPTTLV